jgi:hypothetical protein
MKIRNLTLSALALAALTACSSGGGYSDVGGYDLSDRHGRATDTVFAPPPTVPPVGFEGTLWHMPGHDCSYSRSGRPGEEAWVMILNPIGRPPAAKDCTRLFYTKILDGSPIPGFVEFPRGSR